MKKRIIALLLVAVLCISSLTACGKKPTDTAILVGDIEITREEMMFYLAYYEVLGNLSAAYSDNAAAYWDEADENGDTNREVIYTTAFAEVSYMAIMSDLANKAGFTLTDEQIKTAHADAEDFFNDFSDSEKEKSGITLHGFQVALERQLLVTEYEKIFVKKLSVNEDAIKASIKREDYACKKTEYIAIAATTTDADGKSTPISEKDLLIAKDNLNEALAKAKEGKTFEEIKTEYADKVSFVIGTRYIYEGATSEQAYIDAAIKLENGQYSEFVQGEEGLYIIKMVDTDSPDYYDNAVSSAISTKEKEEMSKYYETISATYTRTIKDSVVPVNQFGSYFIDVNGETAKK